MIRRVIVRPDAQRDISAARLWYRDTSKSLAADFMRMLREAIGRARERPLAFPLAHRRLRRALLHRFPYAIFFDAREDAIVIAAVLHQARDPEILESR